MAYTRPSKKLHEMTAGERAAHYAAVDVEMAKVVASTAADFRRRNLATECMVSDYLRWGRSRMWCFLFVRHPHPSTAAVKVSRSGDETTAHFLPLSRIEQRPQTSGRFLLVMVPRWLREKLPASFCGVTPDLQASEWSDAEREEWKDLSAICGRINYEIEKSPKRRYRQESRITNTISPSNAA